MVIAGEVCLLYKGGEAAINPRQKYSTCAKLFFRLGTTLPPRWHNFAKAMARPCQAYGTTLP